MSILTLKEALANSVIEKYAVGAFNVENHDMAEAVINAAEAKGVPVIINVAEAHYEILEIATFIHYLLDRIKRSPIPLVLHLDHGYTYENIMRAIHYGFSSVMFDGSKLSFKENIEKTKEIVKIAHAAGVSVEAELGHVTGLEGGDRRNGNVADKSAFTRPEEAEEFVQETGIDALAVAIGTVHGIYKGEPQLDFQLLQEIRQRVKIPLVLHGGTGLNREDFQKAVAYGINKINFYTGLYVSAVKTIMKTINDKKGDVTFAELTMAARKNVKDVVIEQIEIFGTRPLN